MNRDTSGFELRVERRWLVLFFDPIHRLKFWDVFNTPGFRHCALLAYLPVPQVWLYVDYAADGTVLCTIESSEGWKLIERVRRNGGTVLEYEAPKHKPRQPLLYPPNCVAFTQQFLGIRKLLWTPYGLALCLARLGAKPMFGSELPERGLFYGRIIRRWRIGPFGRHAGKPAGPGGQEHAGSNGSDGPGELHGSRHERLGPQP